MSDKIKIERLNHSRPPTKEMFQKLTADLERSRLNNLRISAERDAALARVAELGSKLQHADACLARLADSRDEANARADRAEAEVKHLKLLAESCATKHADFGRLEMEWSSARAEVKRLREALREFAGECEGAEHCAPQNPCNACFARAALESEKGEP